MEKQEIVQILARDLVAAAGLPLEVGVAPDGETTIGDYLLWPSNPDYGNSEMVEVTTILGTEWLPGYCVGRIKFYPASRWEPEDQDLQVIHVHRTPLDAILDAIGRASIDEASHRYESLPWHQEPYLAMLRTHEVPMPEHLAYQMEAYAP